MVQPSNKGQAQVEGIALYIHVPFCQTKCPYCDFNTYAGIETLIPGYVRALAEEIRLWGTLLGKPRVSTIFFGGGTPSYIPRQAIAAVLEAAHGAFRVAPDAEITMEANPGDLSGHDVPPLPELGINRLSLGVQSLNDPLLKLLGRRHASQEAVEAYWAARRAGFSNVSIDLMYGLPQQSLGQWRDTLNGVLSLSPEHLSIYCLTLEEGTPMEQQVRVGEVPQPDSDLAADMYLLAEDMLDQSGYLHYEISNWARPGRESRHNLTYWHNQPYLGVGPGAHSYLGCWRFNNIASPREYINRLGDTSPDGYSHQSISPETLRQVPTVAEIEAIDQRLEMAETMMLGLRLAEGIGLEDFHARFGKTLSSVYGQQVAKLISLGLLEQDADALRLTPRGRLLGNEVFLRFF